jgi:hypothetical protein
MIAGVSEPTVVSTEAAMDAVRERVRADLHARLAAHGATADLADRAVFDEVDRLIERALAQDDPRSLLLPARLPEPWKPALSLELAGHRGGVAGRAVHFAKARLVLPVVRWLFEYTAENFRRQQQVNVALMACLQTLAADHARLKARVDSLERRRGA